MYSDKKKRLFNYLESRFNDVSTGVGGGAKRTIPKQGRAVGGTVGGVGCGALPAHSTAIGSRSKVVNTSRTSYAVHSAVLICT